jgi:hypothetical protein
VWAASTRYSSTSSDSTESFDTSNQPEVSTSGLVPLIIVGWFE